MKNNNDELVVVKTEDVKDRLYNSLIQSFNMLDHVKQQLSCIYEGVAKDMDILIANYEEEIRRKVCNEIVTLLNSCDRCISVTITHCDSSQTYPKNEVFVVDDIYEIIEDVIIKKNLIDEGD